MITTRIKKFEEKIFSYINKHNMLLPGERVVIGVSGGADSVCLLFVLNEWKKRYGLEPVVVHVNHGIRNEAGKDADFVENLCRRLDIPFCLYEEDVHRLAAERKCSSEEAGRDLRYQSFRETAQNFGASKIAVAHNLNDRCETVLFHLFRGTGIKGLAGIMPVRDEIIRPLLCVERAEIERYLSDMGQDYCIDSTNEEDVYTRNKIRHHILPYAEQEIVPGCVRNMGRTAEILSETEDYLDICTDNALKECILEEKGEVCVVNIGAFINCHPAIRKRILYKLVRNMAPGAKDISYIHVEDLHDLFIRKGNRSVNMPFGIWGYREYDKIYIGKGICDMEEEERSCDYEMVLKMVMAQDLPRNCENSLIFPENEYTKWFDYDKIKKSPVLRTRMAGDYLTIRDGQGNIHHKKLKDYMVTEKIPGSMRESIPVLAEGSHVLWLVGYRISEYYKVSENTKRVLQVQLIYNKENNNNTEEKDGGKN